MSRRFRFSTRRLFLATAALAVWTAVVVNGYQILPRGNSVPPLFEWSAGACLVVIPTVFLAWLAAVVVRALGKRSILLAFCGTAVFVAFIAFVARATW